MLIDNTYLIGEVNIPNLTGANSKAPAVDQAISQYEPEILIELLGYKLYSLMINDLDSEGTPQTQPYIDLINGVEFQHSYRGVTITIKWNGFVNSNHISLIADYVYYKLTERETVHMSGIGAVLSKGDKGIRVSPVNKMINAWDRMRELYGIIPPHYKRYFDEPVIGSQLSCTFDLKPSAYNYLLANKEKYPDWIFTPQWNINAFGI